MISGSAESEKLVNAFRDLKVETPWGMIVYRTQDNQSTMGSFVGITGKANGIGVMMDSRYLDGLAFQPSDDDIKKLRLSLQ